jgi:hypothetical protein
LGEHYHLVQQQDQTRTHWCHLQQKAVHARCERQPLVLSEQTNEVRSMDFVFNELANGRKVKTLTKVKTSSPTRKPRLG